MVPHKIPKEDFVYQIVRDVVRKKGIVETQGELGELVEKRLKDFNKEFVISSSRAKNIALKVPKIKIITKTRSSSKLKKIKKCPVCKTRIKRVSSTNLMGKKVHMGYKCNNCGFSADLDAIVPMKYTFVWKR